MDKKALKHLLVKPLNQSRQLLILDDLLKMLTKVPVETALNAELDEHLGYEKHSVKPNDNSDSSYPSKKLITDDGQIQ
ncbi:transposase [Vibrio chagasii]|uniref:transposase n=1 Tax=Vibrio chagasii TaxID=170679 RepID=UPI003BB6B447